MNLNFNQLYLYLFLVSITFLSSAEQEHDKIIDELFSQAMNEVENKQWHKAEKTFEQLLSKNNQLHRARVELANVYIALNKNDNAITELDKVLSIDSLPENVRQNIENLKHQAIKNKLAHSSDKEADTKLDKGHSFDGNVEFAIGYDDNVRFSFGDYFLEDDPYYDSDTIELSDGTLLIVAGDGSVYDVEGNFLFENDGTYNLDAIDKGSRFTETRLNLFHEYSFNSPSKVKWSNTLNIKSINNLDFQTYSKFQIKADSAISLKINNQFGLGALVHYRVLKRDGNTQVKSHGIDTHFTYLNDLGSWQLGLQWLQRNYKESMIERENFYYFFDEVDSRTKNISIKWSKLFKNNRLLLLAKFDYSDTQEDIPYLDPEFESSDHTGIKYSAAAVYSLTSDIKVSLTYINLTFDYSDYYIYFGEQKDVSKAIKSKITYNFNQNLDVYLAAEYVNRTSDQYEGISSNKSLAKIGVRMKF
ncbi:tetratricopeptide repeat protein [Pseudoalteromonas denitrificans]|uniref:Uncharacterized protein n=1 Tax=Pseudoalteromonas denitrificans DSM 6059 TaxID=1123010 RepID=A0A1I1TQ21_9GAMM|nr:tetratricopeptide repeat protein [Pseudoalteromonas denitrificans]SFD58613.1 hypothetical protein SAMN02745724_04908 [Pseudoalteromonas denitrificans DSM 6059]